jgi:excinuclease UvrABC helicase subunit UvrB
MEAISIAADAIEKIKKTVPIEKPKEEIKIDQIFLSSDSTPEEIENIKKTHPELSDVIDGFMDSVLNSRLGHFQKNQKNTFSAIQNLEMLSSKQLRKALNTAVEENKFEDAAKIRDEINKRHE